MGSAQPRSEGASATKGGSRLRTLPPLGLPRCNTHNQNPLRVHPIIALAIVLTITTMMITIDLDHQSSGMAVKICDIRPQPVLLAKLEPAEPLGAQPPPEQSFGRGEFSPELLGANLSMRR